MTCPCGATEDVRWVGEGRRCPKCIRLAAARRKEQRENMTNAYPVTGNTPAAAVDRYLDVREQS